MRQDGIRNGFLNGNPAANVLGNLGVEETIPWRALFLSRTKRQFGAAVGLPLSTTW